MHAEMNPEKTSSNGPHFPSTQSKTSDDKSSFQDKIKQIRSIIFQVVPGEKQKEILTCLQELNDIYLIETQSDKIKNLNGKNSEYEGRNYAFSNKDRPRVSEKEILEVREGAKIVNQIKIDVQVKSKSPQRKAEDKKFMKFQPKKANKVQSTKTLGTILKPNVQN